MQLVISPNFEEMSETAAEDFVFNLSNIPKPVICFPSGKTPVLFLQFLRNYFSREKKLPDWFFIGLDEWVGIHPFEKGSCRQFFDEHFFHPLNIPDYRICFFNGTAEDMVSEQKKAENFISAHKGIDITVLGIGTNGHLGLNEPGSDTSLLTQIVELTESTKQAATDYFDEPRELRKGITLGLKSLLDSKTIFLMASGENKSEVIRAVVEGPVTSDIPGSFLQQHPNCFVYLDENAASKLK